MIPFFHTQQRVALLNSVALSWIGTPFHPNGMTKGRGVSCQKLFGAIMIECGVLPVSIEIDSGPVAWNTQEPMLERGMDLKLGAYFENILGGSVSVGAPVPSEKGCTGPPSFLPGDTLGFNIGGVVRHLGVCINEELFVHVMRHSNVTTSLVTDATWCQRITRAWRAKG